MNKSASLIARILLMYLGFHFVVGAKKNDIQFKVRISEKGTRFSEKIEINENENTVQFMVPKHNDVDHSEVLNEFNLNLTIARLPDVGVCYIKPLDKNLPNPRKMKSDMTFVKRVQTRIPKPGTLVSSSKWMLDTKLEVKELHPTVVKFCAALPVYRLKEITKDNWEVEQEGPSNDSTSRSNRQRRNLPMCSKSWSAPPCSAIKWKLYCKLVGRTCVYWAQCNVNELIRASQSCNFQHSYSSVVCCEFRCH